MTTFTIIESSHKNEFLEHINSIDKHIQFTGEDQRSGGAMPFLDILITPGEVESLSTSVFRKPTVSESIKKIGSKYGVQKEMWWPNG